MTLVYMKVKNKQTKEQLCVGPESEGSTVMSPTSRSVYFFSRVGQFNVEV